LGDQRKITTCLVDSGATCCIISLACLRTLITSEDQKLFKPGGSKPRFFMADGSTSSALGSVMLELEMDGEIISQEFWVMKNAPVDIILGNSLFIPRKMDISNRSGALVWDDKNNQERKCKFFDARQDHQRTFVAAPIILGAAAEGVVPPFGRAFVPSTVIGNDYYNTRTNIFGIVSRLHLQSPSTYICGYGPCHIKKGKAVVEILNADDNPLRIYPGMPLANFTMDEETKYEVKQVLLGSPAEQRNMFQTALTMAKKRETLDQIRTVERTTELSVSTTDGCREPQLAYTGNAVMVALETDKEFKDEDGNPCTYQSDVLSILASD